MRGFSCRGFLLSAFIGVLSFFSGHIWADSGHVLQLVKDSFPAPYFAPKPSLSVPSAVALPVAFKSGHGLFMSPVDGVVNPLFTPRARSQL